MTLLVQVPEKTEEAQRMEEKFTPDSQYLVQAHDMKMYFPIKTGWFHSKPLKAVDGVSFDIRPGETLGLVGESGCGKTTVGRTLLRLYNPTGGEVYFDGKKVDAKSIGGLRKDMQMVFQDPYSSLNPRMTVEDIIGEPLDVHKLYTSRQDRRDKILHLMELVGLNAEHATRYAHEFSGGQRQRIGIARALATNPRFIVCDEAVSALDVSIQAQVINMFEDLQKQLGVAYLFISQSGSLSCIWDGWWRLQTPTSSTATRFIRIPSPCFRQSRTRTRSRRRSENGSSWKEMSQVR